MNNRIQQLRYGLARFIAGRGTQLSSSQQSRSRSRYSLIGGGYPGMLKYLSDQMKELRPDPEGLALASEASVWAGRCIELRCKTIARMPWAIYSHRTGEKLENTAYHRMIAYARTEFEQNLDYLWEQSLSVHGETYLEKLYLYNSSLPGGLRALNAIAMHPYVQMGRLYYYEYNVEGEVEKYYPYQLVVNHYSNPLDDFRGSSPMTKALDAVNIKRYMHKYIKGFYRNDGTPGGFLYAREGLNISETEEERLIDQYNAQTKGADNAFKTIFMPHALEYEHMDNKPPDEQSEMDEGQRGEICGAFHVPPSMVGAGGVSDPLSAGGTMDAQKGSFFESWAIPECDDIAQVKNDVIMPWLDPTGDLYFEYDYTEIKSLIKQTKERSEKVRAEFAGSAISFNEMRVELGYDTQEGGDFWIMPTNVIIVRADQFPQIEQIVKPVMPGMNLNLPTGMDGLMGQGAAPVDPLAEKTETPGTKSLTIMLSLANNPDLVGLQNNLRGSVGPDVVAKWNTPDSLHVTLLSAPLVTDEQIAELVGSLDEIDVPEMALRVGSLWVFNTGTNNAVHYRVKPNADLTDVQSSMFDLCSNLGMGISQHTSPSGYVPHITMCYTQQKPARWPFNGKITVNPTELLVTSGEEVVYRRALGEDSDTPTEPPTPPEDEPPQPTALDELGAWKEKVKKAKANKPFTAYKIPADIADRLRQQLETIAPEDRDAVKSAFDNARWFIEEEPMILIDWNGYRVETAVKTYTDTRDAFVREMVQTIGAGQKEENTRRAFASAMRTALRQYGLQAFRDGMNSVNYEPESLSADELKSFRDWQDEQSSYVTNLGAEVFREGITEAEVAQRAQLWADVSLQSIYYAGIAAGDAEQNMVWKLGNSEDSCDDCPRLDGYVRPMKYWMKIGLYPGSGRTECKLGCKCGLERTDLPVTKGALPFTVSKHIDLSRFKDAEIAAIKAVVIEMGDVWEDAA